jgi:hypothetical protein
MVLDRETGAFTQVTATTGNGNTANIRARISSDGNFVAFQSTRDFSGALPGGTTCTMLDGTTACGNADGNGEIMLFDRENNRLTQLTSTTCGATTGNERVEISKEGKYVTWQSKCEAELNPTPACGDCNGNDEVFVADVAKERVQQVTITDSGDNRVPRVSGSGRYIVWESNDSFLGANPGHNRTLYVIKRNSNAGPAGHVGPGQVEEDATLEAGGITENAAAELTTIDFSGGFNSTVEQFAISAGGRKIAFDNKKNVGNQEIFLFDRKK